jgi:hypothetical protein
MRRVGVAVLALAALAGPGGSSAQADSMWELENARANARAGGPVGDYDEELLERWGCLSGTNSAFCKRIQHGANSASIAPRRRWRKIR